MAETQRALADRLFPVHDQDPDLEFKNVPPEQRRLHTETADLTVSSIQSYLANGKLIIPEFQRGYVWTRGQASRLIESLLIQCPIPVVYLSQATDNKLHVIDGNQRLLSIKLFLNDGFELQQLTAYPELNGISWSQLDPRFQDHILNRTLRCITILKDTHPQIKYDVFERLNTGSVKLNAQELRHGINYGPLMMLLDNMARDDVWRRLAGIKKDTRMRGGELVLRYLAFRHSGIPYVKPLSSYLDAFSEASRSVSPETQLQWMADFQAVVRRIDFGLGSLAFRIFEPDLKSATAFNSALYDAQMVGFARTRNDKIRNSNYEPEKLQMRVLEVLGQAEFLNSIRQATSDEGSVRVRMEGFVDMLDKF